MDLYFNMFKIKYSKLDELLAEVDFDIGEEIIIFINLESILKKITTTIIDKENVMFYKRNTILTACVFNLIAHYRYYFHKRAICSRIYVYGPESMDKEYLNNEYNKDYRKFVSIMNMDNTTSIGTNYKNSIRIIKTILNYVEGVNFITSGIVEPSVIPLIVRKELNLYDKQCFLITDDKYEYQYIKDYFRILKPRQDKSLLIDDENVMDVLKEKTKCKNICNPNINFLPFIISMLGDKYRNIDKIKGIGIAKIYNEIKKGLEEDIINNEVINLNSLINIVPENFQNDFAINYMTTSIFEQYKKLSDVELKYITNQIMDKYDGGYIKKLNDEYFIDFPLNIIEINSGIKKKPRKIIWENKCKR